MTNGLYLRGVTKSFDGVTVLQDVDLDVQPGEIHGLVGENGSGKSTLVKVLSGVHRPEAGMLQLWGEDVDFPIVNAAKCGIVIIHQDLALADHMSVAENVSITAGFGTRSFAPIRRGAQDRIVRNLAAEFGHHIDPRRIVATLPAAERSMVGILRALRLASGSRRQLIVLDEPTAALPREESTTLLALLRRHAEAGSSIVFISHRLREVLDVCDRVTVLRSGRLIATSETSVVTEASLVAQMLGYELGDFYPNKQFSTSEGVIFEAKGLSGGGIRDLTFRICAGEIIGVTGLAGMGQDVLPYLLAGSVRRSSGTTLLNGAAVRQSVRAGRQAGISLVPGNRLRDALWLEGTATENLTLSYLDEFWRHGRLRRARELGHATSRMTDFGTRPVRPRDPIARYSGGNQQKVVLARALRGRAALLILHEPTQGVDAGAKKDILELVKRTAASGSAVLVCSSDAEEVAQLCHRVIIMSDGRQIDQLSGANVTVDQILVASRRA
jgi:ribose transport system ATP-binding protein